MRFIKKWGATIAFLFLVSAQVYTLGRLYDQTQAVEELTIANTVLIAKSEAQACAIRLETRENLRNIFFDILEEFEESPTVESIRMNIEENYPPIACEGSK